MTNNLVQSTIQLKDENKNWQIVLQSFIHFPPQNKLYNHFNRTNVKISYSCMPNMNSYIYMHHHKVLMTNLRKRRLITAAVAIKILVLHQTVSKQKA